MASILASLPVFQGKKPVVPDWKDITLAEEQLKAVKANQAAVPEASKLATETNKANQAELERMLEQAIPGYQSILGKQRSTIESQLRGEIPDDVNKFIQRQTAFGALKGGFGGSEMGRNLTARDLGLTSLDITNRAVDSASRWMANTQAMRMPGQFDVTSMFVTPGQMFAATFQNQMQAFERDMFANKIAAAPEPWAAHMGQALDDIADTALSVVASMYGGQSGAGKTKNTSPYTQGGIGGGMTMGGNASTMSSSGGGGMFSMMGGGFGGMSGTMGGGASTFQAPAQSTSPISANMNNWNWR